MKKLAFPDALVLIFFMIVAAQVLTYILPAGKYEREEVTLASGSKRDAVVAESYHQNLTDEEKAKLPVAPHTFLDSVLRGMEGRADVIFFVFIIGGVIAIVKATGSIDALLSSAIKTFGGSPVVLVAGMTTVFAVGSSTIGMAEEYMPLIPILVSMCLAMKMDAMVAMGIVYVGAGVGYGCAAMNPFTVLIAQDIAGLEAFSGQWYRWVLLAVCTAIGVHHIMRYAKTIQQDPGKSLVADVDYSDGFDMPEDAKLTDARRIVLVVFVAGIAWFVWGAKSKGWYLHELSAIFLGVALVAACFGKLSPNRTAREFSAGACDMTSTALLIGFAGAIKVVMDKGMISDTVIYGLAQPLKEVGAEVSAVGMLLVQSVFNFFVPSGSGQALVTMPIMAPLADITEVPRQVAVLAYQMGDGFTNMIVPTNALLMGMLLLGRIPYTRWLKFIVPLLIKLYIVSIIALIVAMKIGYGVEAA